MSTPMTPPSAADPLGQLQNRLPSAATDVYPPRPRALETRRRSRAAQGETAEGPRARRHRPMPEPASSARVVASSKGRVQQRRYGLFNVPAWHQGVSADADEKLTREGPPPPQAGCALVTRVRSSPTRPLARAAGRRSAAGRQTYRRSPRRPRPCSAGHSPRRRRCRECRRRCAAGDVVAVVADHHRAPAVPPAAAHGRQQMRRVGLAGRETVAAADRARRSRPARAREQPRGPDAPACWCRPPAASPASQVAAASPATPGKGREATARMRAVVGQEMPLPRRRRAAGRARRRRARPAAARRRPPCGATSAGVNGGKPRLAHQPVERGRQVRHGVDQRSVEIEHQVSAPLRSYSRNVLTRTHTLLALTTGSNAPYASTLRDSYDPCTQPPSSSPRASAPACGRRCRKRLHPIARPADAAPSAGQLCAGVRAHRGGGRAGHGGGGRAAAPHDVRGAAASGWAPRTPPCRRRRCSATARSRCSMPTTR